MELLYLERACLQILSERYRETLFQVSITDVRQHFPQLPYEQILTTFEKLETLGLVQVNADLHHKRHQMVLILPTGKTHLYLEGRLEPVRPGHLEVVVQLDRSSTAELCDALAGTFGGESELVTAIRNIAEELRKPPQASAAAKIQAATSVLGLAASAFPLVDTVLLPAITRLASGG